MSRSFNIEEYCLDNLDKAKIAGTGQIHATCPWCGKYGSFYVSIKKGHYICHSCEAKGLHLVGVVAQIEGITWRQAREQIIKSEITFRRHETSESLLEKIRALRPEDDDGYNPENEKVKVKLPDGFNPVYDSKRKDKWMAPLYLAERKIKKSTARAWGMGYCNHGKYSHRLIIPVRCDNGFSFTARGMESDMYPRYLNPPAADNSRLLLGWDQIIKGKDLVLCEGPLDAVRLWQHGIQAVSLMGKVLHPDQIAMLFTLPPDTGITIMLDPEEAEAPYKAALNLICRFDNVYIAKLPMGVDPGDSTKEQAQTAYDEAKQYTGERIAGLSDRIELMKGKMSDRWS